MVPLKYAEVSTFSDIPKYFLVHKYKLLVFHYTHAKFKESVISQSKTSAVRQYDPLPWGKASEIVCEE